jgi:quercetin dioxygenase-like cupin family protein
VEADGVMHHLVTGKPAMRERVERLEAAARHVPQVECPVRHHFAPGICLREISIPAGTVVTGAVHKTENLIIVSIGRLQVVTEDGTKEVKAGDTLVCKPGMKNAVVALEDSRWTNVLHNPTNETDIDKLVEVFTESTAAELLGGPKNLQALASGQAKLGG